MHCGKSKNHVLKYKTLVQILFLKVCKIEAYSLQKKTRSFKEAGRHLSDDKAREKKGRLC